MEEREKNEEKEMHKVLEQLQKQNEFYFEEIKKAQVLNRSYKATLQQEKLETKRMREQIGQHTLHQRDLSKMFSFERGRAKVLPKSWTIAVVLHGFLVLQNWSTFRFFPFLLNLVLLVFQWRRLYLPGVEGLGAMSFFVIVFTIWMYHWGSSEGSSNALDLGTSLSLK